MIERLIHSLQALAAPAHVQLVRFPNFLENADELARDYADALRLVADCPQLRLESAQRDALDRLDDHLDRMIAANAGRWTEDAVRSGPAWDTARGLARDALATLGAPDDRPPLGDTVYVRGRAGCPEPDDEV